MRFTLRQARKLENSIQNVAIHGAITDIRAYDEEIAEADIEFGVDAFEREVRHVVYINEIRHAIRNLINVKNMECGVSDLLNKREALFAELNLLDAIGPADDTERLLRCVVNKPAESKKMSMVRQDMVDWKEDRIDAINENLDDIKSELIRINNSVTIELSEDHYQYLLQEDLV